ncbi:MAG: transporter, partial [Myxococcota bacterium]
VAFGDATAGLKVAFEVGRNGAMSFVPSVSIPVNGGDATGRLEWNWSYSPNAFGLMGNLAGGTVAPDLVLGEGSIAVTYAPSDPLWFYLLGVMLWVEDEDPDAFAGAGMGYMLNPALQVDFSFDVGLTEGTTRLTVSAGLTVLLGESAAAPATAPVAPTAQLRRPRPPGVGRAAP